MPEFLHVNSYLVKEHCSLFFPAEFRVIFKTKTNKIGPCFLTAKLCKNLYEILTNETASDGVNDKRHCPIKFDNTLWAWVCQARVVEICPMVCFAAQTRIAKAVQCSYWNCSHCLQLKKRYCFVGNKCLCCGVFTLQNWPVMWPRVACCLLSSQNNNAYSDVFTFARECFVFPSEFACATSVSCNLKSSEFKKVCYNTFLSSQKQLLHCFLELVHEYRGGFVAGKLKARESGRWSHHTAIKVDRC